MRLSPSRNPDRHSGPDVFLLLGIALLAALLGGGCTWFRDKPELSAEDNYQKGMAEFQDEDYEDSIPYFQKILENYPFSMYALSAELKIAEAYFLDEKYIEALVHLQGFEELHPTNDQIPFVLWMKATSFYEQFSTIDRDISTLENARRELEGLQSRFPASPYAEQAEPLLEKVMKKLAERDFYVARFYYRDAKYEAALPRFQQILDDYSGEGIKDRATYYLGKCHYFLKEEEQARRDFQGLLESYPDSPYAPHARTFLQDLERGRHTIISKYFRLKERTLWYLGYE